MTDDPVHCDRTRRIRAPGRPLLCPIRSPGTGEDTVERDLAAWGRRLVEVAAGLPTAAELGTGLGKPPVQAVGISDPALARGLIADSEE